MKQQLRKHFLQLRDQLSLSRRKEAQEKLFLKLSCYCASFDRIASFASMKSEIDLTSFNVQLAYEGRLLLPRRSQNGLEYYRVVDFSRQMALSHQSLLEPNPTLCEQVSLTTRDLVLVPGLAFDKHFYRLGFGKGHFDRFFALYPFLFSAGICFQEQISDQPLPRDSWDFPVKAVLSF